MRKISIALILLIFLDAFQCTFFPGYTYIPTVATIKSDNEKELADAISKLNKSGGIIYIDTPIINVIYKTSKIKLSGSIKGGIIGMKQKDGSYPVIKFNLISYRDCGIEISGSNQFIKYLAIERSKIGVRITGSQNILDHVISRYNMCPGFQLSDNAISNIFNYCYSYRNFDILGINNASGFSLKPGSSQNVFRYCFAFDNFNSGWEVNDKEGDSSVSVSYLHSASWNNGNIEVFIGKYDFDNNWPLDKNFATINWMLTDPDFESNYNKGQFIITQRTRIYSTPVSDYINLIEKKLSSSGFTFGSKTTAKNADVKKTASFCIAFDHKSIGFDNNDSEQCTGDISYCAAFKNKINYQLPYTFDTWTNNWSWLPSSSHQFKQDQTLKTPIDKEESTNAAYAIRNTIFLNCNATKFDDYANFDDVIKDLKE